MCVCALVCFDVCVFFDGLALWKDWRAWGDTGGGVRVSTQCSLRCAVIESFPADPSETRCRVWQEWLAKSHESGIWPNGPFSLPTSPAKWQRNRSTSMMVRQRYQAPGPWDRPLSWHTRVDYATGRRLTRNDKWQGPDKDVKLKINSFQIGLQIVSTCLNHVCL